jgi:anti-sigma factor RsiW
MTRPDDDSTPRSWQQLLAAYADGELDAATRERVRNWLDEHPPAHARIEEQWSLSAGNRPFWEMIAPPEPDAATWARVWNRIEAGLEPPTPAPRRRLRGPWWRRGLAVALLALPGAAAAAAAVVACLPSPPAPVASAPADDFGADDVFQVAAAGDVEILSIRDADVPQLVVGEPPFNSAMTLAGARDFQLKAMRPASDGMVPEVNMGGSDAPLIHAPVR